MKPNLKVVTAKATSENSIDREISYLIKTHKPVDVKTTNITPLDNGSYRIIMVVEVE